jgi:hypothetical protein
LGGQDQVERAILMIHCHQAVECQQAREQCAEPEDRWPDARKQREVGADGERHQRHHDEKEQHADQRAAADAHGEPHVADEKRAERGHGAGLR